MLFRSTSLIRATDRAEAQGKRVTGEMKGTLEKAASEARSAFNDPLSQFEQGTELSYNTANAARHFLQAYPTFLTVLPAEFATLRLETVQPADEHDRRIPIAQGDKVYLLASDTKNGEFCARMDRAMLAADPDVEAEVHILRGVDVSLEDDFLPAAAPTVAEILVEAWSLARDQDAILSFHLNGGYKVTIPLFIYLASHLPAKKDPQNPGSEPIKVEAFFKHENSHKPIKSPILLGGVPEALRHDLEAIDHGTIADGRWEGYAYTRTDTGGWQRTFLGEVIRHLSEIR